LALRRTDIDSVSAPRASARLAAAPRAIRLPTVPWLIAMSLAAAYVVVFVVLFPRNIAQLGWEPEVSSGFVMSETLVKTGAGGFTVMGSTGQWVPLWFGLLTAWLPLHRALWELAPTLAFAATTLIVGWSVAQLANRRAAILAVLIGLVASPLALAFFMVPFAHNTVYPCTALLGAYLIWLARGEGRRRFTAFAVPPILGIAIGACVASDVLLAATAVIPLALTALLAGVRRDRRSRIVALSALTTVVVTIPAAKLTSTTMSSLGFVTLPTPLKIASLSELPARLRLLYEGLQALFNGYLGSERPGTINFLLGVTSDIVMSLALLALLAFGVYAIVGFMRSGLRRHVAEAPDRLARSLHISYWVISALTACGAFWIAGEGPITTHESYYATVIFSVAAVLPLLLLTSSVARWAIPAGASALFTASLVGLASNYFNVRRVLPRAAPAITKVAEAEHAQVGYTNWEDASGLTWGTDNRVIVRPLVVCPNPAGANLCPGFQAFVPSWYTPHNRRTFLLLDPEGIEIHAVPPGLGKPLAVYNVGAMQMIIYPYDIASRLGRAVG
jgi:hypothetical protein